MEIKVTIDTPVAVRRPKGSNITFVNQDAANDVYLSEDYNQLASSLPGTTPSGLLLAHGGGQIQWSGYPGVIWVRAAVQTNIQVTP